jgi:hypothetical protein
MEQSTETGHNCDALLSHSTYKFESTVSSAAALLSFEEGVFAADDAR